MAGEGSNHLEKELYYISKSFGAGIASFKGEPLHAAYQGSMHQRPVSVLKKVLGSQAQTQGFEGSQQTLLSSKGLRRRRGREKERS